MFQQAKINALRGNFPAMPSRGAKSQRPPGMPNNPFGGLSKFGQGSDGMPGAGGMAPPAFSPPNSRGTLPPGYVPPPMKPMANVGVAPMPAGQPNYGGYVPAQPAPFNPKMMGPR